MKKQTHPFKLTLLSLAILANFSAYAHAEYTESETTIVDESDKKSSDNAKKNKSKAKKKSASTSKDSNDDTVELKEMVVTSGREKDLIGVTGSASQGEVSHEQFEYRPLSRNGELVEVVPGAVATQHSGSGKANQYFLRGYNLDHGTDFTTVVDGIPMNMPTHAHGQGYMDINSVIPELVDKIEYGKGPYYAEIGDFSAAGFTKMSSMDTLEQGIAKFTAGEFGYYRGLVANSSKLGDGNLLYGGEVNVYDGAWTVPENSHKYNGMLRYTLDQTNWGVAVNAKAYSNAWTATNQLSQMAIDSVGLYGSMSPSDGGNTNRYSFSTNLWNKGSNWKNNANLYAVYYDLDLYSNFTGFLNGPQGDQIHQFEHRVQVGGNIDHTRSNKLFGFNMDNTVGFSFRHDEIMGLGLDQTENRQYLDTISHNNVGETTAGIYFKNETFWLEKLRTIAGLRGDFIRNDVTQIANGLSNTNAAAAATLNAQNSGKSSGGIMSPKFGIILGPWYDTEYFINTGSGYHSNDARGTVAHANPFDGATTNADGSSVATVTPLARAYGGEVGIRSNFIPRLNSTLALWWLHSAQELVFSGDDGTTSVNGASRRYGIEFTNYYKVNDWLTLDFDYAQTSAHYVQIPTSGCTNPAAPLVDVACTGNYIPNSVGAVISSGIQVVAPNGMYSTLRLRHFGDSPLDSNGTYWSGDTNILNLGLGYKQKSYKLDLSLFNLLGTTANDIAYAYTTQYPANGTPQYGVVRHPVEPRMVRGTITVNF